MWEVFGAGLAFVFPVVLHYSTLWGEALLEKVVTPFPKFDAAYNKRPLLLSLMSGVFLAAASLARPHAVAFTLVAVGLTLLVLDLVASLISIARYIKKRRRR